MANEKRLIDANTLKAEFTGNFHEMWHYTGIRAMIDVAPIVDAVEVVRCKDCKHLEKDPGLRYDKRMCLMRSGEYGYCKDDDFCSYGERREG